MGFVSSFLINGSKKSILIDSGFGILNYADVLKDLTTHEIEIANTHIHPDHSNGNGFFTQTLMSEIEWKNHGLKWNKLRQEWYGYVFNINALCLKLSPILNFILSRTLLSKPL